MGKKCFICKKRKAKYPTIVYPLLEMEKEVELCCFCYRKYIKLKERYLHKAYLDLITFYEKGEKI